MRLTITFRHKVVRENVNKLFDKVHCGGKGQIRDWMIMNLTVIRYPQMPHYYFPVDFDLVLRCYDDVMSFVIGFPYTFRPLVLMCFLGFLNM